jgi:hypothetical protein
VIVRALGNRLHLITQPDHAHLAGRIMTHCVALAARPRRDSILLAAAEHDNGWAEEDAAPTVDPATGAVVDFINAPLGVRHDVWPRAVARLAEDPWAAALVAQHAITVYDRFRSDAAWTSFFEEMEDARDVMLGAGGPGLEELTADYVFVRLADLISLTFCAGWTGEQRCAEWTVQLSGARVVVSPDAFGGATVPMAIEARVVPRRPFGSDADLREALKAAATTTLRGEVAGRQSW